MTMQTTDWLDLMKESGIASQQWQVKWSHENHVATIRNEFGACPLCALANAALHTTNKHTTGYLWALDEAFGTGLVRVGAYDIADAADQPLSMLPESLKLVRRALGLILNIPVEKL